MLGTKWKSDRKKNGIVGQAVTEWGRAEGSKVMQESQKIVEKEKADKYKAEE